MIIFVSKLGSKLAQLWECVHDDTPIQNHLWNGSFPQTVVYLFYKLFFCQANGTKKPATLSVTGLFNYCAGNGEKLCKQNLSDRRFSFSANIFECCWVLERYVRQAFAIQIETFLLDAVHELAVLETVCSCCSVDASDPQSTELSFLHFPIAIGVGQGFADYVYRSFKPVFT